jgi:hypothetical protein
MIKGLEDFLTDEVVLTNIIDDPREAFLNEFFGEPTTIMFYITDEEKKLRHEFRLANCGKPMWELLPPLGFKNNFRFHCGIWRECKSCYDHRCEMETEHVIRVFMEKRPIEYAVIPKEKIKKHIKELNQHHIQYRQLPQEDGSSFFYWEAKAHICSAKRLTNLKEIDFHKWMMTPEGKNVSGKLGKDNKKKIDHGEEKYAIIKTKAIRHNGNDHQDKVAWDKALKETAHLRPDIKTLQECCDLRYSLYEKYLKEQGVKIEFSCIRHYKVYEKSINWQLKTD